MTAVFARYFRLIVDTIADNVISLLDAPSTFTGALPRIGTSQPVLHPVALISYHHLVQHRYFSASEQSPTPPRPKELA
ncbi:hypothetical protein [Desulfofustis limnaeus]|jgi:hypothetical protein|uniref:hypothetical protein n=1 Tax=Desulfofustis limnaeus TaxID=2740163 RepID=UPI0024E01591|nr:hypothetical protein [Desulfofustis limnaeus]